MYPLHGHLRARTASVTPIVTSVVKEGSQFLPVTAPYPHDVKAFRMALFYEPEFSLVRAQEN